jgi:hypothetical protein|nr:MULTISPECIES: hypothetical protein [Moraxella]
MLPQPQSAQTVKVWDIWVRITHWADLRFSSQSLQALTSPPLKLN